MTEEMTEEVEVQDGIYINGWFDGEPVIVDGLMLAEMTGNAIVAQEQLSLMAAKAVPIFLGKVAEKLMGARAKAPAPKEPSVPVQHKQTVPEPS